MRLLTLLVGVLGSLPTVVSASSSVLEGYRGSARQLLVNAGSVSPERSGSAVPTFGPYLPAISTGSSTHSETGRAASEEGVGNASPTSGTRVKSPVKAFFLSLLLPGLGEFYTGHRIRGAVFLAIEGTAWTTWGVYRGKGKDWDDRYIAFQAQHWSFERYDAYRHAVWDRVGEESNLWDPVRPLERRQQDSLTVLVGSHHYDDCCGQPMPSDDDRYEIIGKYYRFSYGWDDVAIAYSGGVPVRDSTHLLENEFPSPLPNENGVWGLHKEDWKTVYGKSLVTPVWNDSTGAYEVPFLDLVYSANREEYTRMRQKAHDAYSTVSKMTTVILFNHVISAIDAARMAKHANQNDGFVEPPRTQVRMTLYQTERDLVPMLVLWRRF